MQWYFASANVVGKFFTIEISNAFDCSIKFCYIIFIKPVAYLHIENTHA
mgnify:FL=1